MEERECVCCCFCGKGGGKALFNRNEEISNGERFLDDEVWGERLVACFGDLGAGAVEVWDGFSWLGGSWV